MTQFVSDLSHYDPIITLAIARQMVQEGIVMATHKVGEGTGGDDAEDGPSLANLRDAGMPILGGYHVVRSGSVAPQVKELLYLANRDEPWWQKFPYWCWQADLERWEYDNVPASTGISFAKTLREETQRQVILYASRGQYGDSLTAWDGPLWNANYGHNPVGPFKSIYPGDSGAGWVKYSGQYPSLWQYGSNATIAGMTTCDVSAFRGTLAQLKALIEGDNMPTVREILDGLNTELRGNTELATIMKAITWQYGGGGLPGDATNALNAVYDISHGVSDANSALTALTGANAVLAAKVDGLNAVLTSLQQSGTSLDTEAIKQAIQEKADATAQLVNGLQAQIVDLQSKLAAAARAQADQLS